jgi:tetraacyldisaccharide-1-P 4'-kinase
VASLPPKPIWLLCALADPREVEQFYRNLGVLIEKTILFSDHETFDLEQVKAWQAEAQALGAVLAVTAKDWVKLKSDNSLTPFVLRRKIVSEGWLETLFKR